MTATFPPFDPAEPPPLTGDIVEAVRAALAADATVVTPGGLYLASAAHVYAHALPVPAAGEGLPPKRLIVRAVRAVGGRRAPLHGHYDVAIEVVAQASADLHAPARGWDVHRWLAAALARAHAAVVGLGAPGRPALPLTRGRLGLPLRLARAPGGAVYVEDLDSYSEAAEYRAVLGSS